MVAKKSLCFLPGLSLDQVLAKSLSVRLVLLEVMAGRVWCREEAESDGGIHLGQINVANYRIEGFEIWVLGGVIKHRKGTVLHHKRVHGLEAVAVEKIIHHLEDQIESAVGALLGVELF